MIHPFHLVLLLGSLIALAPGLTAADSVMVSDTQTTIDTAQSTTFAAEIPPALAGKAELYITAYLLDPKVRGYSASLKILWDGVPLTECLNRPKDLEMKDGRLIPTFVRGVWTLPYGPSAGELESAAESPYYIPKIGRDIVRLRFALPDSSSGSHIVEIQHTNEAILQPIIVDQVSLAPSS